MDPGFRRGDTGVGAAAGARFMPSWVDAVGGNSVVDLKSERWSPCPAGGDLQSVGGVVQASKIENNLAANARARSGLAGAKG